MEHVLGNGRFEARRGEINGEVITIISANSYGVLTPRQVLCRC